MPLHHTEIARRENGRLELRTEPVRVRWSFEDLASADGHTMEVAFSCSVRALPEPAEQRMLEEVFLTSTSLLTATRVAEHFAPAFRATAADACQRKPAADWLSDGTGGAIVEVLRAAGKRIAFSCGLELLAPFEVDIQSRSLEQQRIESMQRALAEQRTAGRMQHLQRAGELLREFEQIRQSAPQLSPGEVLRQISPADQGALLQTLLLASGKEARTESIWAVAGPSLVRVQPARDAAPAAAVIPLPPDLGPLRSVQPARGRLLVGARSGVMFVDPAQPNEAERYSDPSISSTLGFNRAVVWHDEIWACHSEAGIVAWKWGQGDRPAFALRCADLNGAAPKNLALLDDERLIFSTGDTLMLLQRGQGQVSAVADKVSPGASAEVVAVLPEPGRVTVVLRNGRVQCRDPRSLSPLREEQRCGDVTAAALLPWLGSARLLLATEDGPVFCVGWDDDLVTQYLSPHRALRALAAAQDVVIALSADRQRLLIWNAWNPRQPAGEVFVTPLARHRAADVAV